MAHTQITNTYTAVHPIYPSGGVLFSVQGTQDVVLFSVQGTQDVVRQLIHMLDIANPCPEDIHFSKKRKNDDLNLLNVSQPQKDFIILSLTIDVLNILKRSVCYQQSAITLTSHERVHGRVALG